jgi:glutathione S-transferase
VKLYVCYGFLQNVRYTPRPGGHPCGQALHALREAGHEPEVIPVGGLAIPPLNKLGRRDEVEKVSGQRVVPVLVTDSDEVITDSKRIRAWASDHPAQRTG